MYYLKKFRQFNISRKGNGVNFSYSHRTANFFKRPFITGTKIFNKGKRSFDKKMHPTLIVLTLKSVFYTNWKKNLYDKLVDIVRYFFHSRSVLRT